MDTQIGTGPYTADIGDGMERFDTLADLQRAMRTRVSGIRSSSEWYRQMRSRHSAKVCDAAGKVVANVSYNGRLWRARGIAVPSAQVTRPLPDAAGRSASTGRSVSGRDIRAFRGRQVSRTVPALRRLWANSRADGA
jgi:hypothetical protein